MSEKRIGGVSALVLAVSAGLTGCSGSTSPPPGSPSSSPTASVTSVAQFCQEVQPTYDASQAAYLAWQQAVVSEAGQADPSVVADYFDSLRQMEAILPPEAPSEVKAAASALVAQEESFASASTPITPRQQAAVSKDLQTYLGYASTSCPDFRTASPTAGQ